MYRGACRDSRGPTLFRSPQTLSAVQIALDRSLNSGEKIGKFSFYARPALAFMIWRTAPNVGVY